VPPVRLVAGLLALALLLPPGALAADKVKKNRRLPGGASHLQPQRVVPVPDDRHPDRDDDAPLDIDVWLRGGERRTFYPGESVTVFFRTNRDAHVLLYDVDTEGRVHQIYPRSRSDEEFVEGGVTYAVPGRGAGYRLIVTGPSGYEDIVALASDRPLRDRWDECLDGFASGNDYDELGGTRLRMGRLEGNRARGMDELTRRLVEMPDEDPHGDSASDRVTFRVARRHHQDRPSRRRP
jgi:hypothetical protein